MRAVLLAVAAVVAWTGCGRQHGSEQARVEANGEQTISIDAHDMAFRPKTISVEPAAGDVVVTVRNTGRLSHTFTTDTPAGDVVLQPGDTRTVRFPAGAPVRFFCRFHEASGMRGAICPVEGECRST